MNVGGFSHKESTSVDDNVAEQHTHTGMGDDTGKTGAASEGEKLQYKAEYQQHLYPGFNEGDELDSNKAKKNTNAVEQTENRYSVEYRKWSLLESNNGLYNRHAETLADAGFYDTVDGGVRCFSCGVGLEEYTENDLPWELHAKYSPKCRHILSEGSEYFQTAYLDIGTNKVQIYGERLENLQLKEMALCKVCCDETSSILFLPCLHLCVCLQCSYNVSACPSCGENISQRSQYKLDI